jgi:hypothetical protein
MAFSRVRALFVLCLLCLHAPLGAAEPVTRARLIGAWRLVGMDYSGPNGSTVDPFYQKGSTGMLIYDASGWMSVHIVGPNRRAWDIPAARATGASDAAETTLKGAAFDTYYTYFGTWEFDAQTGVVTHRVASALIPAETGLSYAQSVALEGGRLIFTTRVGKKGAETVRRKIWARVDPA